MIGSPACCTWGCNVKNRPQRWKEKRHGLPERDKQIINWCACWGFQGFGHTESRASLSSPRNLTVLSLQHLSVQAELNLSELCIQGNFPASTDERFFSTRCSSRFFSFSFYKRRSWQCMPPPCFRIDERLISSCKIRRSLRRTFILTRQVNFRFSRPAGCRRCS